MKPVLILNQHLWRLACWMLALGLASLACNLPYLASQGEQLEAEIAEDVALALDRPIQDVRLEGSTLALTYQAPLIQAPETSMTEVVLLLQSGAVAARRVEQVRVEVERQEAPYMAITAQAKDARLLADGRLALEAFLAGLQVEDLRPVEMAVRQELELLGYAVRSVSYQGGTLELAFWQPEISSVQDMLQSWLPVWRVAAWKAPEASLVVLHAGLLGQPDLRVAAPMGLLQELGTGNLPPADFLLGLEIQDEQP